MVGFECHFGVYERRVHELEAEVSNMNAKHEAQINQLKQEFESILWQKHESSREAVTQAQTFGGDPSANAQYEDLPPGTDPKVEIAVLKQALESKEQKVESLQAQVRSFEGVIKHTKEQSKQVVKLKQELTALKVRLVCIHTDGIPQIEIVCQQE